MIVVNSALKQNEIIETIEGLDPSIHFLKKQGISLQFESSNDASFAPEIKKALKADTRFKALFFNVEVK